jgi:hypothetical protein
MEELKRLRSLLAEAIAVANSLPDESFADQYLSTIKEALSLAYDNVDSLCTSLNGLKEMYDE